MEPKDVRWQVWWLYEGAWWGRKAKMLKNHWFLYVFLRVKEAKRNPGLRTVIRAGPVSTLKKCDFWLKMLYAAISNCASCAGGEHIFRKIKKTKLAGNWKMEPKDLRWQVWWLYEGAWWGRKAKMLKNHRFSYVFLKVKEAKSNPKLRTTLRAGPSGGG